MNEAFQKYKFPNSTPKKILIPRISVNESEILRAFQLKLDLTEEETMSHHKKKEV